MTDDLPVVTIGSREEPVDLGEVLGEIRAYHTVKAKEGAPEFEERLRHVKYTMALELIGVAIGVWTPEDVVACVAADSAPGGH